jgi:DNA-binding NtrC family response regulator
VRQLQNVLEEVVVLSDPEGEILPESLPALDQDGMGGGESEGRDALFSDLDLRGSYHDVKQELIDRFERQYLARIVAQAGGNMSKAARRAGIDRTTLYRLMDKHELSKDNLAGRSREQDEED